MSTTRIKQLPDLILHQTGLSADLSTDTRKPERWYIHWNYIAGATADEPGVEYHYSSRDFLGNHGYEPVATVRVILPSTMSGTADDIREDCGRAVELHAKKYLS